MMSDPPSVQAAKDALAQAEDASAEAGRVLEEAERRVIQRRGPQRTGGRRATDPTSDWVSISDYARIYGVDRGTVYKWLQTPGVLDTYSVGTLRRIRNIPPKEIVPANL
jgi:hypothetical protein